MWYLGEKRYVYTVVTSASGESFTITSATYVVYDCSDESVVINGDAEIAENTLFALWTPTTYGIFAFEFKYVIGYEEFTSRQIIEVKETM